MKYGKYFVKMIYLFLKRTPAPTAMAAAVASRAVF